MIKINNFQIYCLLVLATVPIAYLIAPMIVTHIVFSAAWLVILTSVIPGAFLVYIYLFIIKKSTRPFPLMMEDCFGKIIGKSLGILYIVVFLMSTSLILAIFVNFIGSSIVPDTPLSVFIGAMLLASFYALKAGLVNIARVSESMVTFGICFSIIILLMAVVHHIDVRSLMPATFVSYKNFFSGIAFNFLILGNLIVILVLAFYCDDRDKLPHTLFKALLTYVLLISFTTAVTLMHFGSNYSNLVSFPTFKIVRLITIGEFLQNIDIIFISVWIAGIFGSTTIKWFMTCYIAQQVLGLKDYRFLAAPSSVIIGVMSLLVGSNIVELEVVFEKMFPALYGVFFIFIPLIMFVVLLFKPDPANKTAARLKSAR